jgi:ABC-type transporter Mla MlaB component
MPVLQVTPLADRCGLSMSGSAGYDTRDVVAAAAAAVRRAPAGRMELHLSNLHHLDSASLVAFAEAAAARPTGSPPLRVRGAPPPLIRLLELFPELGAGVEVVER